MTQRTTPTTLATLFAIALITPAGVLARERGHNDEHRERAAAHSEIDVHDDGEEVEEEQDKADDRVDVDEQDIDDQDDDEDTEAAEASESADADEPSESTTAVEAQHFQLAGTVTAASSTALTANGQTVQLTSATKLHGTVTIGSRVHVEGTVAADGSLMAKNVHVMPVQSQGAPPARFQVNDPEESDDEPEDTESTTTVDTTATSHEEATEHAGPPPAVQPATPQHGRLNALLARIRAFLASHFHA